MYNVVFSIATFLTVINECVKIKAQDDYNLNLNMNYAQCSAFGKYSAISIHTLLKPLKVCEKSLLEKCISLLAFLLRYFPELLESCSVHNVRSNSVEFLNM